MNTFLPLPIPLPQTYAPFPVWSGSTTSPARFVAMPKKAAVRLWHRARDFDRGTHQPGRHGGAVGPTALQVLHALIFDFLNHRTGRLDPSYAAIAHKAGVCARTVATALARLRELGIPNWVRWCAESWRDGRILLEQETNAHAVPSDTQWQGYRPQPPAPGTWNKPPMPSVLAQGSAETGDLRAVVGDWDESDRSVKLSPISKTDARPADPLPAGSPVSWGTITAGTLLEGQPYPYRAADSHGEAQL